MEDTVVSTTSDYWVGVVIGRGSFGTVWHGQHKQTQQSVAIKVFDKCSLRKYPSRLVAVRNEQRILRQCLRSCPYVAQLLASFHDAECVYLVMECYTGGDLGEIIRHFHSFFNTRQPPPSQIHSERLSSPPSLLWHAWVARLAKDLLQAVQGIHQRHVIHGDLKPENIVLTDRGRVVLVDFGSALATDTDLHCDITMRGTAAYAAPEVIQAQLPLTSAADIWSLGCIFHALWTGQSPFQEETEALIVESVLAFASKPSVDKSLPQFPQILQPLLLSMLDPCPSRRPAAEGDYEMIESTLNMWEKHNCKQVDTTSSLYPLEPAWIQESWKTKMRDGSGGWQVFLME